MAYSLMCDESGAFQFDHGNVVYLYRFVLHEAFSRWKLAVIDGFCRQFENMSLIVTQPNTIWLSEAEFSLLGFGPIEDVAGDRLPAIKHPAPRLIVRDMTLNVPLKISDYPKDYPPACAAQETWLEETLPADAHFA